jgi:hypothetical protein
VSAARVSFCASPASLSSRPEWAGFFLRSVCERRPTQRIGDSGSCRKGSWQGCSVTDNQWHVPSRRPCHPEQCEGRECLRESPGTCLYGHRESPSASPASLSSRPEWAGFFLRSVCERRPTQRRDRGNIAALLATNGTYPTAVLVIPRNARDLLFVRARHPLFCTPIHNFAQTFPHNSIDAAKHCDYLPRQIEPGSVRTLRLSSKGAAT